MGHNKITQWLFYWRPSWAKIITWKELRGSGKHWEALNVGQDHGSGHYAKRKEKFSFH